MSVWIGVLVGLGAAVAYGAATAVQHSVAKSSLADVSAAGFVDLVRSPRWMLGIGGDSFGLALHVVALALAPAIIIQPLLILALPISLPVGWLLGGPKPQRRDYYCCGLIVLGLGVFFLFIGDPGDGSALGTTAGLVTIGVTAAVGLLALLIVQPLPRVVQAAVYGTVAGAWFGVAAVLMDSVSNLWEEIGWSVLTSAAGLVSLAGLVVLGVAATALTQLSFGLGELRASSPANVVADPLIAVVLGIALLDQNVTVGIWSGLGFAACFLIVLAGTVGLAGGSPPRRLTTRPGTKRLRRSVPS